ncbi:hypothetical protein E8E13_001183 [Curvularia kusanoi]|uniref:Uncharacterized protein n=1 Tax=Curvularia kusanoi TaxID=90978 RepID=A0A9P4T4Q5_CURKU|nr:hypothetical protein E8E13_001183 [Curvularia kusanoi]
MDPRTAMLAVQLQLADIAEILNDIQINKDKRAKDEERASLETVQQDLVQQLATLEGQVLVIKILKQEFDDRAAYKKLLDEEKQAVSDHELAMRLAGMTVSHNAEGSRTASRTQHESADDRDDNAQWEMAKQLYTLAFEGNEVHSLLGDMADHSALADREPLHGIRTVKAEQADVSITEGKDLVKCNACMEPFNLKDTLRLQCHHTVPIPLDTCRIMLSKEFIKQFDLKVEELATPNPTYCANPDCSKFIRPGDITAKVADCVFCQTKTYANAAMISAIFVATSGSVAHALSGKKSTLLVQ